MFLACRVVSARVFTKQPQLGESVWKLDSLGQCRDWIAATSDMAGESVARPVRQTSMARVFHAKPEQFFIIVRDSQKLRKVIDHCGRSGGVTGRSR